MAMVFSGNSQIFSSFNAHFKYITILTAGRNSCRLASTTKLLREYFPSVLRFVKISPGQNVPGVLMRIDISGPARGEDQPGSVSKYRYQSCTTVKIFLRSIKVLILALHCNQSIIITIKNFPQNNIYRSYR